MAALTWNNAGERFFETGVDRGVLFVGENPGVPWNGLVGVSEAPTGGEPTPYYNDGLKYINLATAEEYAATIEALSSPPAFDECDGTGTIGNGLFVTQQIRKQFHLSYRTRVGNDIEGTDHGYKIHLVYNALAGPSARPYTTLNDSTEAMTLSWGITTIPAIAAGFKPTAHYVIDSRKTPKVLLRYFELMLYGDEWSMSSMPSAQEVTSLFTSPGPIAIRNLVQNPVGSTSLSASKWIVSSGETMTYVTDEEAPAISVSDATGVGAAYVDPLTSVSITQGLDVGVWLAFGFDVKPGDLTTAKLMSTRIAPYGGLTMSGGTSYGKAVPLGEFTRLSTARQITAMPDGAYARTLIWPGQEYLNNDPYFRVPAKWSNQTYVQPIGTGLDAGQGSLLIPANNLQSGAYNTPVLTNPSESVLFEHGFKVLPGEIVNIEVTVVSEIEVWAARASTYVRWYDSGSLATNSPITSKNNTEAIPANTNVRLVHTHTAPATPPIGEWYGVVGVYKQALHTGSLKAMNIQVRRQTEFRFRNAVIALAGTYAEALAKVAAPLDGDMADSPNVIYSWEGAANASYSTLQSWGDI